MLFFDDSRDGRYGNCVPVSELGVMSVHCPRGLTDEWIWENSLEKYKLKKKNSNSIVEWDGSVTEIKLDERHTRYVKSVNAKKRFGFIQYGNSKTKAVFFYFSSLPGRCNSVEEGDKVSFINSHDTKKGKMQLAN